jgi:hypothetical protein
MFLMITRLAAYAPPVIAKTSATTASTPVALMRFRIASNI